MQVPAGSHGWAAPGRARARRASSLSKPAPFYGRDKACCSLRDERKKEKDKEGITVNDLMLFKTRHSRNRAVSEIFQLNELKVTPGATQITDRTGPFSRGSRRVQNLALNMLAEIQ